MPSVSLTVNGRPVTAEVEGRTLLVKLLREHLRLTGTHVGCDTTQCGACTVLFNGDGVMKPEGAKNVLEVLSQFSPNVQGKKDSIDLSKTYTTTFVSKAKA